MEGLKVNDYVLLIFNCVKYRNKALHQKNTWLRELSSLNNTNNLIYFHVIGNPNLEQDFLINEEQQILWIKVDDDYNSLPKKVIYAYEAISKVFHFKYIFKTDDDQIVSSVKIFDTLINLLNTKYNYPIEKPVFSNRLHYGGHIVDVKCDHISQYFKLHPELPSGLIVKKTPTMAKYDFQCVLILNGI